MRIFIGLFVFCVGFWIASNNHLHQGLEMYFDWVAVYLVLCGTGAVMIMNRPVFRFDHVIYYFFLNLFKRRQNNKKFVGMIQEYIQRKILPPKKSLEQTLFVEGIEMIDLGLSEESLESIIYSRFNNYRKKINMIGLWMKKAAKYPPAFGLAGTVIGLIHIMGGLAEGVDIKEIGVRMGVALVATLYGVVLSNILLSPLGEFVIESIKFEEEKVEILVSALLLVKKQSNLIEIQEVLNSYLDQKDKINLLKDYSIGFI